jgi:protein FRG1
MSEVVSKKLKFKGDKPKKKKRSHKEEGGGSGGGGGLDDLAVLAAADPRGTSCLTWALGINLMGRMDVS